ncbi:MAG: DctP family TRAP transporter solute-binding subunit [Verrucomicrobia bacterium]|nr:DctP family TRAP transporter solute-binding subunit [Verrucomicrobiota bacterium]
MRLLAVAFAGLFLAACSHKTELKREYRMQVVVGPTTYWGMGAAKFAELVAEKTDGRINVKPYYGSQLLKGAQLNSAQMVSSGAIDLALDSTINVTPVIPDMNVFALPFFVNTYENLDRLEDGETGRLIFQAMRQKGLMPLAWGENGFRQLTNSKRAVRMPGDVAGLRIRVVGSPIFIDIFRALGADPVNMNWGDAVTAFQQGVVDGQENPVGILLPLQIYQYHRHATFWNYLADPLVLYWCRKEWESFPADIQSAVQAAAIEAARFEKALCRAGLDGETSLTILRKEFGYEIEVPDPVAMLNERGMEVEMLSADARKAFQSATKPVFDQWVGKIDPAVYKAALDDMSK